MVTAENRDLPPAMPSFTVAMRGYDRMEVDSHVQRMASEVRLFAADRDAALRQAEELARQLDQTRSRVEELKRQLDQAQHATAAVPQQPVEETPDQARRTLALAEAAAAETAARAEAAAETTWSKAEDAAGQLRARYQTLLGDLDKQQAEIIAEHQTLMEKARGEAAALTTVAAHRRKQLDSEEEQRRRLIEADFVAEINDKRAAALAAIAADEAERKAAVEHRLNEAVAAADLKISRSNNEATELRKYRERIADQLRSATGLLNEAGGMLEPLPEERG